jgi:hypothetical protein
VDFTVTYEAIDGTSGTVVRDVSLYEALRELAGPFERVVHDDAGGVAEGFRETAPRHLPTHAGKLTQRRTLLVPAGMTASSISRLARYLRVEA